MSKYCTSDALKYPGDAGGKFGEILKQLENFLSSLNTSNYWQMVCRGAHCQGHSGKVLIKNLRFCFP